MWKYSEYFKINLRGSCTNEQLLQTLTKQIKELEHKISVWQRPQDVVF